MTRDLVKSNNKKVKKALEILRRKDPSLIADGELQLDAALSPDIAQRKCPDSPLNGNANILIFPDLDSGNIGYKLAQQLGGAMAVGPITQGFQKPVNDLSRGASVDDIVLLAAVSSIQANLHQSAELNLSKKHSNPFHQQGNPLSHSDAHCTKCVTILFRLQFPHSC
mgnify:CR=1 FL=1